MQLKSIIKITAFSFLFAATAAFADKPDKAIVGKWADADGIESVEYKAGGAFTETMAGGEVIKGKYSFPDATHLKVEFEGPMSAAGPVVSAIAIKGDEMDITTIEGAPATHYKRQK